MQIVGCYKYILHLYKNHYFFLKMEKIKLELFFQIDLCCFKMEKTKLEHLKLTFCTKIEKTKLGLFQTDQSPHSLSI